jgi:GT2 family glycosyltransferase
MTQLSEHAQEEGSVHEHVTRLLSSHALPEGVLLDLGCGFSAAAASCAELGLEYLGVSGEAADLEELSKQGLATALVPLGERTPLAKRLEDVLAGRQLAAITALDLLGRTARPAELLTALAAVARRHKGAPLVVSVANVSHFDVAAKLISGRWDVTPAGLLQEDHLSLFASARLEAELSQAGWREVKADDLVVRRSDQHFPETLTALSVGTPLHDFLLEVREHSAPGALVDQFVRAYLPVARPRPASRPDAPVFLEAPFLSVIVRTQGRRLMTLEDNLTSLAAQTNRDIEVIVCCHDTADNDYAAVTEMMGRLPRWLVERSRTIRVDGGGRARPLQVGVGEASGRYVAFLDDDDLALCHWVEEFAKLVKLHPGAVARAGCATHSIDEEAWECGTGYCQIGPTTTPYPLEFDLVAHLVGNRTPNCSVAIPRSCFTDLGMSFDEALPVLEDWDMLLNAALLCGVVSTPEVTSLYRRWKRGYASHIEHPEETWDLTTWSIRARFDARPVLVPPGSVSRLTQMEMTANTVAQLQSDLEAMRESLATATTEVADLWVEKGQLLARVEAAEKLLAVAEQRASVAERQVAVVERQVKVTERQAAVAEEHVAVAEQRVKVAERQAAVAEEHVAVAEQRVKVAEQGANLAVQGIDVAEQRAAVAEQHAAVAEQSAVVAQQGAALAEERVVFAEQRVAAAEERLVFAEQRVAAAEQHVAVAEQSAAVAEQAVALVQERVDFAEQRVAAAEQGAALAQQGIALAQEHVDFAEQRVAAAEQGAALAQQGVAVAQERVIFAEQRVLAAEQRAAEVEQYASEVAALAETRLRECREAETRARVAAAERDAALARLQAATSEAEARVRDEYEATKSWKVTVPLRLALRLVEAYRQRSS